MNWTVPGWHAKKSTLIGFEFTDGSIWMKGSGEIVPKTHIAYKIFSREDGSTFKRSLAKPYSNEANREKWKATQFFKEEAERHSEAESVLARMPGIPHHVRPENYKRMPSDETVNVSVPCTCGKGELQHVTFYYNYGDPCTETRIRYICDCLEDGTNYQESYSRLELVLARNEKIRTRREQLRRELEDEARAIVCAAEAKRDEEFRRWQEGQRKKRAEMRAKGKNYKYSASWDIYIHFHCTVQVPMQFEVYQQLEKERYLQGLDAPSLYEDIE
jgi:hypothetical protein